MTRSQRGPQGDVPGFTTVSMAWEAHDKVMHARTEEWGTVGTVGTSMATRRVEATSSKTYMQEVRGAIRGCATDLPLAKAIERRFKELVLRKRGISTATNLVAGVRISERLQLIPATMIHLHRRSCAGGGWDTRT